MTYDYMNYLNLGNAFLTAFLGCALLLIAVFAVGSNPVSAFGKTVIYARYSTDKQREASIDDQIRTTRIHLEKLGLSHEDAIVLYDKGISGERDDRENYLKVVEMIRNQEVSTVACDEISRLVRGPEMGVLAAEMQLYDCRFIAADGHDSLHDPYGFIATIKGQMGSIANRELAHRVRRGIAGRVLDGNGADGTHPFGFSSRYCNPEEARNYCGTGPKPEKEVFINQAEAAVVLEIFTLYAGGMSQSEIARNLNERNIPLGSQSNRRDKNGNTYQNGWHKTLIGKMLKQRKYIGIWIWGEFRHRKTRTGKRLIKRADPRDVVKSERPDLAIVPMDLWDAVQKRLKQNCEKHGFKGGEDKHGPKMHYTNEYPVNMLSGILFCGICGTRMHMAMSKSGAYYRCPIAHNNGKAKGKTKCHQRGWVPYDRAVAALTDYLRGECLNTSSWLDDVYSAIVAEYRRLDSQIPDELASVEARLSETNEAIDNMVKTIEKGIASDALTERLNAREAEKRELEAMKSRLARRNNRKQVLPTREWVGERLANLPSILEKDSRKAALFFRKFFGKISAYIVVAPGKKRGHAEIEFGVDRFCAVREALSSDSSGNGDIQKESDLSTGTDIVRIALAGNDKLDKLMPTIDAMIQQGKTWRQIEADLKINRGWANRYYRKWKSAIANMPV